MNEKKIKTIDIILWLDNKLSTYYERIKNLNKEKYRSLYDEYEFKIKITKQIMEIIINYAKLHGEF